MRSDDVRVFLDGDPAANPWVAGAPQPEALSVVPYDAAWPERFTTLRGRVEAAVGDAALAIEHVGSTAVPGLPAKDVIDIDLIVSDPSREERYAPALAAAGFDLTVREPSWYEHRMFRLDSPRANLHVFGPMAAEHHRHLLFRDWLIGNADDRDRYARAKSSAVIGAENAEDYNAAKHAVVREIYTRIFAALDEGGESTGDRHK